MRHSGALCGKAFPRPLRPTQTVIPPALSEAEGTGAPLSLRPTKTVIPTGAPLSLRPTKTVIPTGAPRFLRRVVEGSWHYPLPPPTTPFLNSFTLKLLHS